MEKKKEVLFQGQHYCNLEIISCKMPITKYFIWKPIVAFLLWFQAFAKVKLFLLKCILLYHTLNSSIPSYLPINRQRNNCPEYLLFSVRYYTLEYSQGAIALNVERKNKGLFLWSKNKLSICVSLEYKNLQLVNFAYIGQFCCLPEDNENCKCSNKSIYKSKLNLGCSLQ